MTHCLYAIDKAEQTAWRNEFRAGWGDMLYETAMYHTTNRTNHYRYTGHIFAEYQRSLLTWLSVGIQTDYEQVWWDTRQAWIPDSQPTEKNRCFYNISLLPSVRFTDFFHPYINLYSSIYIGMTINGGTEQDMQKRHTAVAPAWGFTLIGLKAGCHHFFGTVEIGGLNAMTDRNYIYMLGSRIFTISAGYNF